ncbi:MAG: HDOD domain-containing protein [Thiohalobacteraceae bacterium]
MSQTEAHATRDLASDLAASLLQDVSCLVSPPDICVKVFELVESNDASTREIGEVIGRDPSLTARLLRLTNSAFYNFSRRIDTVSRAVTVIGVRELYSLVIAVSAIKSFGNLPNNLVNIDTFWRHGIYTGLIARALAKRCRVLHPERMFVAGLLHDIGSLVLYSRMPETSADLLLVCDGDEGILHQAELAELGFSHADLGGAMLATWLLPETLQEAVAYHHMPSYAVQSELEASIVHLAENLANRSQLGAFCEAPNLEAAADASAWTAIGLAPESFDFDAIIGEAGLQFTETAGLLLAHA